MNKPFTVAREEFEQDLVKLIERCGIPPIVLIDILEDKKRQLIPLASEMLKKDKRDWEEFLSQTSDQEIEED